MLSVVVVVATAATSGGCGGGGGGGGGEHWRWRAGGDDGDDGDDGLVGRCRSTAHQWRHNLPQSHATMSAHAMGQAPAGGRANWRGWASPEIFKSQIVGEKLNRSLIPMTCGSKTARRSSAQGRAGAVEQCYFGDT